MCKKALKSPELRESVISSWENTGCYPPSLEKMLNKCRKLEPKMEHLSSSDLDLFRKTNEATAMARLFEVKKAKVELENKASDVRKTAFSTKYARVLTSSEAIVSLMLTKKLGFMKNLKSEELRVFLVQEMGFLPEQLMKMTEKGPKKMNMNELHVMAHNKMLEDWDKKT